MKSEKEYKITNPLKTAKWLLIIGIPLCLFTPIIFTRSCGLIDFSNTGNIGDTIGGITAPFINIIGSILVFLALKSQIEANLSLQEQVERQDKERKLEIESRQLNQMYDNLKSSIDNFRYLSLNVGDIYAYNRNEPSTKFRRGELVEESNRRNELFGSEAIYMLFADFYCDFHANSEEIDCNPKIAEIISMLEICDSLLEQICKSDVPDKKTIWTLTSHQFLYRIFPKMRSEYPSNLGLRYCDCCGHNHGLPNRLCELFTSINDKIERESGVHLQELENQ